MITRHSILCFTAFVTICCPVSWCPVTSAYADWRHIIVAVTRFEKNAFMLLIDSSDGVKNSARTSE